MIESPLRTEGNDHIPNVIARDNESLGSPVNCDNCDKVDKDRELRTNHGLTGMTQCPSRIFRKCRHGSSIQILFPSSMDHEAFVIRAGPSIGTRNLTVNIF